VYYRSRDSRLSFDERMAVTRSVETAFSPMFLQLKTESPSLSESDLIYCALVAAGLSPVVIADCLSISKDSLRMRKIRVKEKLSLSWAELLFPKCDDNVAQHISGADESTILLRKNQLNAKVMETRKITFGQAVKLGFRNCFRFSGRASRSEFWYFILFYSILFYVLFIAIGLVLPLILFSNMPHLN
jgi:hypothetical protein